MCVIPCDALNSLCKRSAVAHSRHLLTECESWLLSHSCGKKAVCMSCSASKPASGLVNLNVSCVGRFDSGPHDACGCFLDVQAGAGGKDSYVVCFKASHDARRQQQLLPHWLHHALC